MKRGRQIFPILISLFFGAIGMYFLEPQAFKTSASSIVTFAGFVASATIPASILATTLLRASGLKYKEFDSYKVALDEQITYLFSVLFIAALLMIVVITANLLKWSLGASFFLNFFLSFLIVFLLFRFWGLFLAIRSMFLFYAKTVKREIIEKEKDKTKKYLDEQFLEENLELIRK